MIILTLFVFSSLLAFIPIAFRIGIETQDPVVIETLSANNLIVYANQGMDDMTHEYSSLYDAPSPPQWNASLPTGEYLEIWWNQVTIYGTWVVKAKHVHTTWFGYGPVDDLVWYYKNGTVCNSLWAERLFDFNLVSAWDTETNSSVFTAKCNHISISLVFMPSEGYTDILESYDDGYLSYYFSYEWSEEASGFSILVLLGNLLTFQGVGLGIPGTFGSLLDSSISMFFYIGLAFIIYKIFTGLIPLVSGGSGD